MKHPELENTLQSFLETLAEVDILIQFSKTYTSDELKYMTFNKSALLLLTTKFETFVESIAEQYIYVLNHLNLPCNDIPKILRLHHSQYILENFKKYQNLRDFQRHATELTDLSLLWDSEKPFNRLKIECKFSYGKHGGKELQRLFKQIGIDNIFSSVNIFRERENMWDDKPQKIHVDFKSIFNRIVNMRNNIIHEDASPGLTCGVVDDYKELFKDFATELTIVLTHQLQSF